VTDLFEPGIFTKRRQAILDLFVSTPDEVTLSYEELSATASFDGELPQTKEAIQGIVNVLKPVLLKEHRRAITAVRGRGYKIAAPGTQLELATHHVKKGRRQLSKTKELARNVDLNRVEDPNVRGCLEALVVHATTQERVLNATVHKLVKHDAELEMIKKDQQEHKREVEQHQSELEKRIAALERRATKE